MNLKYAFMKIVLIFMSYSMHAQHNQPTKVVPIKIGDTLPNLVLQDFMGAPSKICRLSAYRGKPLLIDFWATWCGSCIAAYPRVERIKNETGNGFAVLPVTYESAAPVTKFYERRKKIAKDSALPVGIINDKITLLPFYDAIHSKKEINPDLLKLVEILSY